MFPYLVLAHGALGVFDELIFVMVAVVFVGLIAFSWYRSRHSDEEPVEQVAPSDPTPPPEAPASEAPDHFPLS